MEVQSNKNIDKSDREKEISITYRRKRCKFTGLSLYSPNTKHGTTAMTPAEPVKGLVLSAAG